MVVNFPYFIVAEFKERHQMWSASEVVVKCPETKEVVPIGMELTEAAFNRATLYGGSFKCRSCGNVHAWKKADAWVRDRSY